LAAAFSDGRRLGAFGWFTFVSKAALAPANVFAGVFKVVLIGVLLESVVFRAVEIAIPRKRGMQQ
jgi:NitT/TauT family transport system permease protein